MTDRTDIALARTLAQMLHRGQKDKAGADYIEHVERVARSFADSGTYAQMAIAYLHDIVEDTQATFDDLRAFGFSEFVVDAVDALTRRDGETYAEFIKRVKRANYTVVAVKVADIKDHLRHTRMEEGVSILSGGEYVLSETLMRRYEAALATLTGTGDDER